MLVTESEFECRSVCKEWSICEALLSCAMYYKLYRGDNTCLLPQEFPVQWEEKDTQRNNCSTDPVWELLLRRTRNMSCEPRGRLTHIWGRVNLGKIRDWRRALKRSDFIRYHYGVVPHKENIINVSLELGEYVVVV